jgi:hypothetical protein
LEPVPLRRILLKDDLAVAVDHEYSFESPVKGSSSNSTSVRNANTISAFGSL